MDTVSGIGAVTGALTAGGITPAGTTPTGTAATDGSGFATRLTGAIDELRAMQSESSALNVAAVTGDLNDIHTAMIASSRAAVTLELVAAVRNKGVDAFNEIMRMQA